MSGAVLRCAVCAGARVGVKLYKRCVGRALCALSCYVPPKLPLDASHSLCSCGQGPATGHTPNKALATLTHTPQTAQLHRSLVGAMHANRAAVMTSTHRRPTPSHQLPY